ncbi:hypothetical protein Purlil1_13912 [Purpureocillium lilacinum]|uniref:FAD-dependent oxidoreductase 2 FAD-binding domain-containing protein n=1 Tax=Purpureocillium lilacinum TaxID=33203 RepID=A0ABR0BCS1_PURLI|nr:hypothetical protein Purlil1_13912 [Purpureocillium lilacinum]
MRSETCDVLVVGAGAAGLTAAATSSGLSTLIIEKNNLVGGTTALSGGTIWIPGNPVAKASGTNDGDSAKQYLDATTGDTTTNQDALSSSRRNMFLSKGPEMVSFMVEQGFRWSQSPSKFPDYHPNLPGAQPSGGRTLNPSVFDAMSLGDWCGHLKTPGDTPFVTKFEDLRIITRPRASLQDILKNWWIRLKEKWYRFSLHTPVSMGLSLTAQLLHICHSHGNVRLYTKTRLVKLVIKNGTVAGAILDQAGSEVQVHTKRGVLLTTAGYSRNQKLRYEHIGKSTNSEWSLTNPRGDNGIALRVGKSIDAGTSHLDKVWGIPTMRDPLTGATTSAMFELAKPHSVLVNRFGVRYLCESQPYGSIVDSMMRHGRFNRSWLILDQNYRNKYAIGSLQPWTDSECAVSAHRLFRAHNIIELAKQIGLNHEALQHTIEQWNDMCKIGRDFYYKRGADEYQQFIGDPSMGPNPNMGPIQTGPFYAIEVYAGDAGTRGGLLTDSYARVLRKDGEVIPGLYAAGNAAASIITGESPGAGATLGPAMTFAYIAANHMMSGKS